MQTEFFGRYENRLQMGSGFTSSMLTVMAEVRGSERFALSYESYELALIGS